MKNVIATSAAVLLMMSGAAFAQPTVMSDEQMDTLVAGAVVNTVENKGGKVIWYLTDDPSLGYNNGGPGKGNTAKAAPGLTKAVIAGGLILK